MVDLINYGLVWDAIDSKSMLMWQKDTSSFLKIELDRMQNETGLISNVRGYGTHLGFDSVRADLLQRWFHKSGINIHRCGPDSFGLRPSLTLGVPDCT